MKNINPAPWLEDLLDTINADGVCMEIILAMIQRLEGGVIHVHEENGIEQGSNSRISNQKVFAAVHCPVYFFNFAKSFGCSEHSIGRSCIFTPAQAGAGRGH
jgi:hypothetical protein